MAIQGAKLNLFSQANAMQAINPTQSAGRQPYLETSEGKNSYNNPFAGNYAGINTNFQKGDKMFIAAQAGKGAGVGTTLGIG